MWRIGAAAGHVVEASSYFDRLWKRENLVDRYFIALKKSTRKNNSDSNNKKNTGKDKKSEKKRKNIDEAVADDIVVQKFRRKYNGRK